MAIIDTIRELYLSGNYEFRFHIYEKLEEINRIHGTELTEEDVEEIILTGEIDRILDNDRRGKRCVIIGVALDKRTDLEIVCRIKNSLVIISVYVPYF